MIYDFEGWMADEYVEKNLVTLLDTTFIRKEPKGVALVIGAWNYPVQLTICKTKIFLNSFSKTVLPKHP